MSKYIGLTNFRPELALTLLYLVDKAAVFSEDCSENEGHGKMTAEILSDDSVTAIEWIC